MARLHWSAPSTAVSMARVAGSTYSTVQDAQDVFHSAGFVGWAGAQQITDDGAGTAYTVGAGRGLIRATNSATAQLLWCDWSESAAIAIADGATAYVGVEYNAGTPQVVVKASDTWNLNTEFPVGNVVREGTTLHIQHNPLAVGDHAAQMIRRAYETMPLARDERTGGLILGETGTRNVTVTAGALWDRLNRYAITAIDTSALDTMDGYHVGTGSSDWAARKVAAGTAYPNTVYDDGTDTLGTLTANRHAVIWFYLEADGDLVYIVGTSNAATVDQAAEEEPPTNLPPRLIASGTLIGRLIVRKSASSAEQIDSSFAAAATLATTQPPAYLSVQVTSDSNASAVEFNPCDQDNHAAFASSALVPSTGITFTSADGKFTVASAGIYEVSILQQVTNSAASFVTSRINVDGAAVVTDASLYNAAAALTRPYPLTAILALGAGSYVEFTLENTSGANTTTANAGMIVNIKRIA